MEVLRLTASQFIRPMSTGRNRPLLLGCENRGGETFEVVVKFRGPEMNEQAQAAELIAAPLAEDLGLQAAQAVVVEVPSGFESVIPDHRLAKMVKARPGPNFGSVHVGPGFTTWPPGRALQGAQRDQAAEIFAFDTLVQNPDRRPEAPNLWVRSDRIGVLDHEQAFSFLALPVIGGAPKPWVAATHGNAFRFLERHVFFTTLRGGRLDLGPFVQRLGQLGDERIQTYVDAVPSAWREDAVFVDGIAAYLCEARQRREDLVSFVKHQLR